MPGEGTISLPGRLVVVEQVYHQQSGQDPVCADSQFGRLLHSDEQVYQRILKINDQWVRLDTGWIVSVGMLVLSHADKDVEVGFMSPPDEESAPTTLSSEPTRSKRRTMFSTPSLPTVDPPPSGPSLPPPFTVIRIPARESARFMPAEGASLWLRSSGETRLKIHVFPS